jgi:rhodanese-related sulfurtransferase
MPRLPFFWWVPWGRVSEVDAADLEKELQGDAPPQLLDVRTRREFRTGHIAGAVHVPIGELRSRVPRLPFDPQRPIVAICLSAHRSIPAVRLLKSAGFKDARQLAGGMLAWRRKGLPTQSDHRL